jgi:hypothetical protein
MTPELRDRVQEAATERYDALKSGKLSEKWVLENFVDAIKIAYENGASFIYSQLPTQMRWVKCSDEMPEEPNWPELHYRLDGVKVIGILLCNYGFQKTWFEYQKGSSFIQIDDFDRVEWLDESQLEPPTNPEPEEVPVSAGEDGFTLKDMQEAWNKGVEWGDANCEFGGETRLPKFSEWISKYAAVPLSQPPVEFSELEIMEKGIAFSHKLTTTSVPYKEGAGFGFACGFQEAYNLFKETKK